MPDQRFNRLFVLLRGLVAFAGAALLASSQGCSPSGRSGGEPVNTNSSEEPSEPDFPIVVDAEPVALLTSSKPAFSVVVSADRTAGPTGTEFRLTADVSSNAAPVASFSWRVNDGDPAATEADASLVFEEPGEYFAIVTVVDEDGNEVSDGIQLTVFDPSATPDDVESRITPSAGMPGTTVQIESPLLNGSAGIVGAAVGSADPVEVFRPEVGVANFMIPLDVLGDSSATEEVDVVLLIDGEPAETFAFTLSPLPALEDEPGALTRGWLESGSQVLADAQEDLFDAMGGMDADLTAEEIAFLQALLHYASVQFDLVEDALLPLLDELDEQTLTLIDQGLIANGVDPGALGRIETRMKTGPAAKNAKDQVVDQLCAFHEVLDDVLAFTDAVSKGALVTPMLQFVRAGAPLPPAVHALANIALDIGIVGDLLRELGKHVPRVGDSLNVQANPQSLMSESEKAVITVEAMLITQQDICGNQTADLVATMISEAAQRIFLNIPFARMAFIAKNRNFFIRAGFPTSPATIQQFDNYVTQTINTIAQAGAEALGITLLFNSVRSKVCSLGDRRNVRLQPEPSILTRTPNAGNLLNLQDETIDFYCTLNDSGTVTIAANRACGIKGRVLTGQATVNCFGEDCTEDAIGSLEILPVSDIVQFSPSSCTIIKEQLEFRTARLQIRNTHPRRTIRYAGVSYLESDKQSLPKGICEDGNLLPGQSVEDCMNSTIMGCDGPHGFLGPGETATLEPIYTCLAERIYPGSGLCGEMELETQTGVYILQAVFCDSFERQGPFCDAVNSFMKRQGEPSPLWPSKRFDGCP